MCCASFGYITYLRARIFVTSAKCGHFTLCCNLMVNIYVLGQEARRATEEVEG